MQTLDCKLCTHRVCLLYVFWCVFSSCLHHRNLSHSMYKHRVAPLCASAHVFSTYDNLRGPCHSMDKHLIFLLVSLNSAAHFVLHVVVYWSSGPLEASFSGSGSTWFFLKAKFACAKYESRLFLHFLPQPHRPLENEIHFSSSLYIHKNTTNFQIRFLQQGLCLMCPHDNCQGFAKA